MLVDLRIPGWFQENRASGLCHEYFWRPLQQLLSKENALNSTIREVRQPSYYDSSMFRNIINNKVIWTIDSVGPIYGTHQPFSQTWRMDIELAWLQVLLHLYKVDASKTSEEMEIRSQQTIHNTSRGVFGDRYPKTSELVFTHRKMICQCWKQTTIQTKKFTIREMW